MTLRHIRIFVAVCEYGSTTMAGEKLFIAQPSVSLAISELEEYYGVKLFDRIGKRLFISEAGKHFLQYASHIVGLFDDMEKEIKDLDGIGIIRIGASVTIGNYLLPSYILDFKQKYPLLNVKVVIDNSDKIQQFVLKNQIDIGLIEGITHSQYLIENKFCDDELVLICANDHKFAGRCDIKLDQLTQEELILRESGSGGREIFDAIMISHELPVVPAWISTSTQAIIRAVSVNLGISILPYLLVKDAIDSHEITSFKIQDIAFKRNFSVIHHCNKFLTNSAKYFITLCK